MGVRSATRCVELERHDKLSKTEAEPDILILRSMHQSRIEPTKHRPTSPADKARPRLRATLEQAENQKATIKSLCAERGELRKEVTRLNRELARLGKRLAREEQASERHKETIRRQYDEDIQLRAALRRLRDRSDRVRSLTEEVFWLRMALVHGAAMV